MWTYMDNSAVYTDPLNKLFNKLMIKPFAFKKHKIQLLITLMSSSYFTVFWFLLYLYLTGPPLQDPRY